MAHNSEQPTISTKPSHIESFQSRGSNRWSEYLCVQKLDEKVRLPEKAHMSDAGYDLYAPVSVMVPARGSVNVPLRIKIALPPNRYGRVASKSGLAAKFGIDVAAGVIDNGYQGEWVVVLRNHSDTDYHIQEGKALAQVILEYYDTVPVREVSSVEQIFGKTDRNIGGFGSTEQKN